MLTVGTMVRVKDNFPVEVFEPTKEVHPEDIALRGREGKIVGHSVMGITGRPTILVLLTDIERTSVFYEEELEVVTEGNV